MSSEVYVESEISLRLALVDASNEFSLATLCEASLRLVSALVWTDCSVDSEAEAVLRSLSWLAETLADCSAEAVDADVAALTDASLAEAAEADCELATEAAVEALRLCSDNSEIAAESLAD